MRIAYLCYWDVAADGVSKKIESQLEYWRSHGHEAELFVTPLASPRAYLRSMARAVGDATSFSPDLVYLRYGVFGPPIVRLLRAVPTVLEINGDERAELRAHTPGRVRVGAKLVVHMVNRARLVRRAAGLICVTHELAALFADYGRPTVVIPNGADPDRIPWTPAPSNDRPRAVFVGSPGMAWHGVDRLLDLAGAVPEIDFDVIGPRPDRLPPNVTAHGTLPAERYVPLLAGADLAVGSLAMERAGLREGCPLKVREYLLAGLPTVIGYDDSDFPGELPWYLSRYESPEQVRDFVARVRGRRTPREELEGRLSWRTKEEARLAFFGRVLEG